MGEPEEFRVTMSTAIVDEMVVECLRALPYEGCGLLVGDAPSATVHRIVATENIAHSSRLYTVGSRDLLRVDREAEAEGRSIIGVFHSHTHTDPYPSPTDIVQAPDPGWHYVLVSLRHEVASVRSYRITSGTVTEEVIVTPSSAVV
jgi:proteasome lid subunit RPN8/RPN11